MWRRPDRRPRHRRDSLHRQLAGGAAHSRPNLDHPGRIVALELGGSNPAVVMPDAHLRQAVIECARAAFATTGQRCTCTRRISSTKRSRTPSFPRSVAPRQPARRSGDWAIRSSWDLWSRKEARDALAFQSGLVEAGSILVQATSLDRPGHFVTPGVVEVDDSPSKRHQRFGPIAQIAIVTDLDEAIEQSNAIATDSRRVSSVRIVPASIDSSPGPPDASTGTPAPPARAWLLR